MCRGLLWLYGWSYALWKLTGKSILRSARKAARGKVAHPHSLRGIQGEATGQWVLLAGTCWRLAHAEESGEEDAEQYKKEHNTVSGKSFAIVPGH